MTSGFQRHHRSVGVCQAGYSIVEVLAVVAVVATLGSMAAIAGFTLRERLCDATALVNVVSVGKALQKLDPATPPFSQTVHGPAPIRYLPGVRVSRETTLFVQYRSVDGEPSYLVRGIHPSGHTVFAYAGARLYATAVSASPAGTWAHAIRDLMVLIGD